MKCSFRVLQSTVAVIDLCPREAAFYARREDVFLVGLRAPYSLDSIGNAATVVTHAESDDLLVAADIFCHVVRFAV